MPKFAYQSTNDMLGFAQNDGLMLNTIYSFVETPTRESIEPTSLFFAVIEVAVTTYDIWIAYLQADGTWSDIEDSQDVGISSWVSGIKAFPINCQVRIITNADKLEILEAWGY